MTTQSVGFVRRAGLLEKKAARASPAFDPFAAFLLATALSLAGASRPSFWFDEAATVSASASRSVPELWQLLQRVDAVHGLYYLVMHAWFQVVPPTEFWSRAPSGLAIGIAAAGVVVLAKQFSSRSAAICSGVVFAVLPRVTWAGAEARPYAFSTMVTVWIVVLLVVAVRRRASWLWVAYALALAISIVLDVYLALMVFVHAGVVAALRAQRSVAIRFAVAACAAVALAAPFVRAATHQAVQLVWIPSLSHRTIIDVGFTQYFDRSVGFAILAGLAVGAWLFLSIRRDVTPTVRERQLLTLAVIWMIVPTVVLLVYSAVSAPIYYPRYLCFTAPAAALVIGTCIARIAKSRTGMVAFLVALALAALPNYLYGQRSPYSKYGADYSQVADVISREANPGDCLLLDDTVTWLPPAPVRVLVAARPAAYQKLVDVARGEPATSADDLWDRNIAPFVVADQINRCNILWTITERDPRLPDHEQGVALPPGEHFSHSNAFWVPRELGFRLVERWQFNHAQVIKAIR